ncbi:MAG: prolyl oligopeptidase family serine peptidase [Bacteroidota bacterium]|nr:prolyl oligopeptidase family serine peptidase [Bacteroidota bacterium]
MELQRIVYSSLVVMLSCGEVLAQKPALDTSVLYRWPSVEEKPILSSDGNYAGFLVSNKFAANRNPVYFFKATFSSWEKRMPGVEKADFTSDGHRAIYMQKETLHIVTLGTDEDEQIDGINAYQMVESGGEESLLYYSKAGKQLTIRGIRKRDSYNDVDAWLLSANGQRFLKKTIHDSADQVLSLVNLESKEEHMIWEGAPPDNWLMDNSGERVAFSTRDEKGGNHIWYYKQGQDKATEIGVNRLRGIDPELQIGKLLNFSTDGSMLFFDLRRESPKPDPQMVALDVWSYRDAKLQSRQQEDNASALRREHNYLSVFHLDQDFKVVQLQKDGEALSGKAEGRFVLFDSIQGVGPQGEGGWSSAAQWKYDLMDTRTGRRTRLDGYRIVHSSPGGRFLELLNTRTADYSTYELATGVIRPLTEKVDICSKVADDEGDDKDFHGRIGIIGWLPGDEGVVVQDYYDLWELDPMGKKAPINLTHFVGAKTGVTFTLAVGYPPGRVVKEDTLLLNAFDHQTKDNGFYRIVLHREQVPQKLIMGPYAYYIPYQEVHLNPGVPMVKAANAKVFLVMRERVSESPNYFATKDFKTFTPVSDVYPEKDYNWVRSKLISFKTTDGRLEQGILYQPKDFDQNRRYPLIFQYYQRRTAELHLYPPAQGSNGELNVPWFVSHGYLVFVPDIHFALGSPGESVVQTIMGAVNLLKTLPFVDGRHMGIQGHSYGGSETNYLITHTHVFAAAISSSGVSDMVSSMVSVDYSVTSTPDYAQFGQDRMGSTLWERPDRYIKNSPVFYADKVTTPLMLVDNKRDGNVPFPQGLEFFTALRRLGKRVWMLQYDKGGHGVDGKERIDYLLRSTQFFDHYLKGAPTPKWMVEGIPATMKQVDDGLELEPAGVEPGPGLLTPEAQKAVDALKNRKPITLIFN